MKWIFNQLNKSINKNINDFFVVGWDIIVKPDLLASISIYKTKKSGFMIKLEISLTIILFNRYNACLVSFDESVFMLNKI